MSGKRRLTEEAIAQRCEERRPAWTYLGHESVDIVHANGSKDRRIYILSKCPNGHDRRVPSNVYWHHKATCRECNKDGDDLKSAVQELSLLLMRVEALLGRMGARAYLAGAEDKQDKHREA